MDFSQAYLDQIKMIKDLYGQAGQMYDPTGELYGEEARAKRSAGAIFAASGSDVGGTYNKIPLLGIGARYSQMRTDVLQKARSERVMRLLGITQAMTGVLGGASQYQFGREELGLRGKMFDWQKYIDQERLKLEKARWKKEATFGWDDIIDIYKNTNINLPVGTFW